MKDKKILALLLLSVSHTLSVRACDFTCLTNCYTNDNTRK